MSDFDPMQEQLETSERLGRKAASLEAEKIFRDLIDKSIKGAFESIREHMRGGKAPLGVIVYGGERPTDIDTEKLATELSGGEDYDNRLIDEAMVRGLSQVPAFVSQMMKHLLEEEIPFSTSAFREDEPDKPLSLDRVLASSIMIVLKAMCKGMGSFLASLGPIVNEEALVEGIIPQIAKTLLLDYKELSGLMNQVRKNDLKERSGPSFTEEDDEPFFGEE